MANDKIPKCPIIYCCEKCLYDTYSKKDFTKHLVTKKHINLMTNVILEIPKNKLYECICNKKYKHMSSLCKHKKSCDKKEDIFSLLKEQKRENQELKELLNKQNQIIESLSLIKNNKSVLPLQAQNEFQEELTIQ